MAPIHSFAILAKRLLLIFRTVLGTFFGRRWRGGTHAYPAPSGDRLPVIKTLMLFNNHVYHILSPFYRLRQITRVGALNLYPYFAFASNYKFIDLLMDFIP